MSEGARPVIIRDDAWQVAVFIDGRHLQVDSHMTILEAAEANGISIPTLCHDPRLTPAGRCRLCVVEVVGEGLVQACETPVSDGLEVMTLSPRVAETRRSRLNEILSDHNAYCEPPCHYACPAGIDIPAYLAAIASGEDAEAVRIIRQRLPLPRIIGRVCPRPCETRLSADADRRRTRGHLPPQALCRRQGGSVSDRGAGAFHR